MSCKCCYLYYSPFYLSSLIFGYICIHTAKFLLQHNLDWYSQSSNVEILSTSKLFKIFLQKICKQTQFCFKKSHMKFFITHFTNYENAGLTLIAKMWKFHDFSIIQILREINFWGFQKCKMSHFNKFAVPNFYFNEFCTF